MNLKLGAADTDLPGGMPAAAYSVSGLPGGRQGRRTLQSDNGRAAATAVLVSADQAVQDEVARVGAAAGMDISLAVDVGAALAMRPEVLLLDSGGLRLLAGRQGGRVHGTAGSGAKPPDIIVVGLAGDADVWDVAAYSSAARVAVLPAAAGWLAGYLGRRRSRSGGTVLGVLGSGGSGASTTACWLAAGAVETGAAVLLLEADPWGAGLEWALDAADLQGIRWPDLEGISGSLNPVQLAAGLPALGGFSLLARGTGPLSAGEAVSGTVLDAARSGYGLTIVDLGSNAGTEPLLHLCDELILVVRGRVGGILGARAPSCRGSAVRNPMRRCGGRSGAGWTSSWWLRPLGFRWRGIFRSCAARTVRTGQAGRCPTPVARGSGGPRSGSWRRCCPNRPGQ